MVGTWLDLGVVFGGGMFVGWTLGMTTSVMLRRRRLRRRSPDLGQWACLVRDYEADRGGSGSASSTVEQGSTVDGTWRGVRWIRPETRGDD